MCKTVIIRIVLFWTIAITLPQFLFAQETRVTRETISLDGVWQIRFDPDNIGRAEQWQYQENFNNQDDVRAIEVPCCWESIEKDYEGVGWYSKNFTVPASWKDKTVRLHFGAVNYRAEIWLNGEVVDYHDGGYTSFEFEIGDLLKFGGENFLAMRVIGPIIRRDVVIDGIGPNDVPHWRGAIAGGIWQSVKLISTGKVYVKDVFIEPNIQDSTATIHVITQNSTDKTETVKTDFCISPNTDNTMILSQEEMTYKVQPGSTKETLRLVISDPHYWSPDHPFLYNVKVVLTLNGKIDDVYEVRFGMRQFTVKDNDYYLNGKKVYIKSGFWEGLYPHILAYPPDEDFVRKEIRLAKQVGFNCLRPWRKPPPPVILDVADEMGMMIIDCPPIECMRRWPSATPYLRERVGNEIRQMILRDRNHASVIYWELFNEIARPCLGRLKHQMAVMARTFDPTRIIVDESGGWYGKPHVYLPYSFEPLEFNEIHSYRRSPVDDIIYNTYLNMGDPGRLTYLSEVGYGGLGDLEENVKCYQTEGNPLTPDYRYHHDLKKWLWECIQESGCNSVFKNISDYCMATQELQAEGNKLQLEAVRLNSNIDGYCVHAFTGGDWVLGAGILDIFRNPKQTFYTIQQVNQPFYVAIRTNKKNIYAGEEAQVKITAINEKTNYDGYLIVDILSEKGETIYNTSEKKTIKIGIQPLATFSVPTKQLNGLYTVHARLEDQAQRMISENSYDFRVFSRNKQNQPKGPVAILDQTGQLKSFIKSVGIRSEPFSEKTSKLTPVLVANIFDQLESGRDMLKQVLKHVESGGVAIYLDLKPDQEKNGLKDIFPQPLKFRRAYGNWVPVTHVVKDHPIFDGLPSQCIMGQDYQNVCAVQTISELPAEPIVASISWNYRDDGTKDPPDYLGPRYAWYGSDLVTLTHGEGQLLLSTMQLVNNLGKDPVADQILFNMIEYVTSFHKNK